MRTVRLRRLMAVLVVTLVAVGMVGAPPASAAQKTLLPITVTAQPTDPSSSTGAPLLVDERRWSNLDLLSGRCRSHQPARRPRATAASRTAGTRLCSRDARTVPPIGPAPRPSAGRSTPFPARAGRPAGPHADELDHGMISFTNSDPSVVVSRCTVDGGAAASCTSPFAVPGPLSEGSHTVTVESGDSFGLFSAPATVTWVVDTTAPANVVISGYDGLTTSHLTTFRSRQRAPPCSPAPSTPPPPSLVPARTT